MKTAVIIQARTKSTRFPRKVFEKIGPYNSIEWIFRRLENCHYVDEIILAIPDGERMDFIKNIKINPKQTCVYFTGSEQDVMKRVIDAAESRNIDIIVDVTADCPFVDPEKIDAGILEIKNFGVNYCSNVYPFRTSPDGFDIQVYCTNILKSTYEHMQNDNIKNDHVGWNIPIVCNIPNQYINIITTSSFKSVGSQTAINNWAVTLDEPADLKLLNAIFDYFQYFDMSEKEIVQFLTENQDVLELNKDVKRKIPGETE